MYNDINNKKGKLIIECLLYFKPNEFKPNLIKPIALIPFAIL